MMQYYVMFFIQNIVAHLKDLLFLLH